VLVQPQGDFVDGMFSLSGDETRLYYEQRRDHVSLVQIGDGQGEAALNITFVSTYANGALVESHDRPGPSWVLGGRRKRR